MGSALQEKKAAEQQAEQMTSLKAVAAEAEAQRPQLAEAQERCEALATEVAALEAKAQQEAVTAASAHQKQVAGLEDEVARLQAELEDAGRSLLGSGRGLGDGEGR